MIIDPGDQEFVPKPLGMASTSEKSQQATHFRVGMQDNCISRHNW